MTIAKPYQITTIEIKQCDGVDELFYRLQITNDKGEFIFHLTPEQANVIKDALK